MPSPTFAVSRVAFATLLLTGAAAFGQVPPAPPAAAPASAPLAAKPPVDGPAARPRPAAGPSADAQTQTTTLTGRVVRWLPNPNGEVDGLLLDDGTQVAFPPHLSASVLGAVKLRDSVLVTGRAGSASSAQGQPARVIRASEIRSSASGQTVVDQPPAGGAPPAPRDHAALTAMKASGRIATLLHTGRGDVNGVVLDSGTVVRFPPHAATPFASMLKANGTLYAQGYGTSNAQGSAFEATQLGATAESAQAVFPAPRGPKQGPEGRPGQRPPAPPPPVAGPSASAPR